MNEINTLCAEHGSLDGGKDLELRSDGGNAFANLKQVLQTKKVTFFRNLQTNSQKKKHTVRMRLSVHSRASSLARRVTSSLASAIALAQAMRSRFEPPWSPRTNCDSRPISRAIFLAAAMISLSLLDH